VPADPSSPIWIPPGLTPLAAADPLQEAERPDLLAYLATIADPRARAGRRHPLVAILALAAAAVLAGARSFAAIAEWAADAPQPIRAAVGARRDALTGCFLVPSEATIRRTLSRLDAEALAAAIAAWLCDRDHRGHQQQRRRRAVAVDGKCLRGARTPAAAGDGDGDGRPVHLLACMDHATRAVLAQTQVGGAPEEVPAFQPCWGPWTWPAWWSPPTRSRPTRRPPSSSWPPSRPTTCLR
jgi:DDE_Tnp_1-associated